LQAVRTASLVRTTGFGHKSNRTFVARTTISGNPAVPPPVETEVKLELPTSEVAKLNRLAALRRAKSSERTKQVSVYFDTDKFALRENGVMFRVRRNGSRYVQTIKTPGSGLLDRNELETELKGNKPDFSAVRHTALAPLFTKTLRKSLRPIFETRIDRTSYPLRVRRSQVEVTLDRGKIDTGNRSHPVCEIEIELKAGDKAELFKLARTICHVTSAELSVKSKAQRGYELLDDDESPPAKADAVDLSPQTATRDAFAVIAASCVKQVIVNKPAVLAGNPDGVHQMRIGLRRLRAAISLFSGILQDSETNAIKSELKWLTDELGPAREFEVLLTRVVAPARRHHARLIGMQRLSRELARERKLSNERAQNAVRSERFRRLLLRVATWLEIGGWRNPRDDLLRERADTPIATSAAAQLRRRSRKIRKRSRMLPKLDQRRRHKLRIQAKKLRYAAEFFETLFAGKRASKLRRSFLSALEDMQDCLGDLNDIAVHKSLTADIALDPAPSKDASGQSGRAFAAGVLTGREEARLNAVMTSAVAAADRFAKAKPFWK
jgi:inorganic triphosphatase YgiF